MDGYDEGSFQIQKPALNIDEQLDRLGQKTSNTGKSLASAADDVIDLMMGGSLKIGKGFKNIKQKPWAQKLGAKLSRKKKDIENDEKTKV